MMEYEDFSCIRKKKTSQTCYLTQSNVHELLLVIVDFCDSGSRCNYVCRSENYDILYW